MILISIARKPLAEGLTVALNVLKTGGGALNIDRCRVDALSDCLNGGAYSKGTNQMDRYNGGGLGTQRDYVQPTGRWPANVVLGDSAEIADGFPFTKNGGQNADKANQGSGVMGWSTGQATEYAGDSGSAARFFKSFDENPTE